jgi:hypothetical protein
LITDELRKRYAIAVAGRSLGREHRFIDRKIASGEPAKGLTDVFECAVTLGLMDQAGAGDRTGIDHRIERMIVGIEPDRIERVARGFDTDRAFHACGAKRIQRQREHEGLGDRLDGKGYPCIADLVDVPVDGGEADTEKVGVGLAQFRNVVGDRAASLGGKFRMATGQEPQQRRFDFVPAGAVA